MTSQMPVSSDLVEFYISKVGRTKVVFLGKLMRGTVTPKRLTDRAEIIKPLTGKDRVEI